MDKKQTPAMPWPLQVLLILWMAAVVIITIRWVPAAKGFADPESARLVILHVPCAMIAVVAYVVSMVYAVLYLTGRQRSSDTNSAISARLGFAFTILATATGMIFARLQWGSAWNWDPRETSILMLLIVYAGYLSLRGAISDRNARARVSAVYSILAGLVMPYLVFVVPRIMGSLHPSRAGLSPEYRIAMAASAIGFVWIYVWLFRYLQRKSVK